MMKRFMGLVAGAVFSVLSAHAQMPVISGEPALTPVPAIPPQLRAYARPKQAILPPVSVAELASVRNANLRSAAKGQARRVVIGVVRNGAAPGALSNASGLSWVRVPGGHAAQLAVTSPEAGSLRLAIDLKGVPEDVEMVFFGSASPARLEGPVKVGEVRDRTAPWWSPLTEGATQTVEFFIPERHQPAAAAPRVVRASHILTTPSSRFTKGIADIGTSGACNVDVPCSPLNSNSAFRDVVNSVAQMVFTDGDHSVLCTGSLLADGDAASQTPWFYSANHCFDSDAPFRTPTQLQQVANSLNTLWGFQASACGSNTPIAGWTQLYGGATYVYNNPQTDVLLVRLNNAPPAGSFYSGWDANPITWGTQVAAIHHPQGDLKMVSQGSVTGFTSPGVADANEQFIGVQWSSGTTEPGSSGGGLWSPSGGQYYFRGGLWGGAALCTNLSGIDSYSRFDRAYPQIAAYLGAAIVPAADYSDLWWNPNESGWGLNLVQHPSKIIFGVWYTYEFDGTPIWYVIPQGSWTSSTTYTGPLFATLGPSFTKTFIASQVQPRQVGTATLNFTSASTGTFTYSVDGVSGTKSMQRQPF